jgi:ABC-type dipeptide/oligopeptide/nickel transport system ATPase component
MTISIKKNKKPDLPSCEMLCDKKLHSKLDNYELTKFLNTHSTNLIVGKPGSGKTSMLYSFMKSKKLLAKVYDKIYLFQPEQSRASMKDKLFDQLPDEQKFDELTVENLEYIKDNLDEDENICIIFDDMGAYLKNNETRKLLKEIIMNRRHYHISIYFLVQTWYSIEKDIRKLFSNLFVFKCSRHEMLNITSEMIEQHNDKINDIVKIVYDKPHNFLFINVDSQRMFKNWDEMIFDSE